LLTPIIPFIAYLFSVEKSSKPTTCFCLPVGETEAAFNPYPRETEFPTPLPTYPHMRIGNLCHKQGTVLTKSEFLLFLAIALYLFTTFVHSVADDINAIYSSIPLPHLPPDQTQYASDNWPERYQYHYSNIN
jgi:hypothetical protein